MGVDAGLLQQPAQVTQQPGAHHAARRDVDRDGRAGGAALQGGQVGQGAAQDPPGQVGDDRAALGAGQEQVGQQQPALGVLPAHQRLEAGHRAGPPVDLRLVVDHQLLVAQRPGQLLGAGAVGGRPVAAGAAPALGGGLGVVHRGVGGLQQVGDGAAVVGVDGQPDGRGDRPADLVETDRLGELGEEVLGSPLEGRRVGCGEEQGELVAAQAHREVLGGGDGPGPLTDLDEHPVTGVVPQGVVDGLEAVQVEQQQPGLPAGLLGVGDQPRPLGGEDLAGGQAGQGVLLPGTARQQAHQPGHPAPAADGVPEGDHHLVPPPRPGDEQEADTQQRDQSDGEDRHPVVGHCVHVILPDSSRPRPVRGPAARRMWRRRSTSSG